MDELEVFADVACPFAHAGLARYHAFREAHGLGGPVLRVRAWPLELVNRQPLDGSSMVAKVEALRAEVAVDRFGGFDPAGFPATSLPAMACEAAAYRVGLQVGERFSLAVRAALFDEGLDVSDGEVLGRLCDELGVPAATDVDAEAVRLDLAEGQRRGVVGSPHFFTATNDFFCPSMRIEHDEDGYDITFDVAGFERFVRTVLPETMR